MTLCQPLPRSLAEEMLQVVARAICDRPGEKAVQRESRTRQLVYTTVGFEPRDGLELMLSTMAVGHYNLILDSMSDVFLGQQEPLKARTKSTVVALDRAMLGFVKEFRLARRRPGVKAEDAVEAEDNTAAEAMPETTVARPVPVPEPAPAPTAQAEAQSQGPRAESSEPRPRQEAVGCAVAPKAVRPQYAPAAKAVSAPSRPTAPCVPVIAPRAGQQAPYPRMQPEDEALQEAHLRELAAFQRKHTVAGPQPDAALAREIVRAALASAD